MPALTHVVLDTSKLKLLQRKIAPSAHKILDKAAFDVEKGAKQRARVDTGAMRSSVYVSGASGAKSNYGQRTAEAEAKAGARGQTRLFSGEERPSHPLERVIGAAVVYALGIELTVQAFLKPAVEAAREGLNRSWKELLR